MTTKSAYRPAYLQSLSQDSLQDLYNHMVSQDFSAEIPQIVIDTALATIKAVGAELDRRAEL